MGGYAKEKALRSQRGKESVYLKKNQKKSEILLTNTVEDVILYIKTYQQFQKRKRQQKDMPDLSSIPVSNEGMQQIGIDLCNLWTPDCFHWLFL